jgi:hypothetical protein
MVNRSRTPEEAARASDVIDDLLPTPTEAASDVDDDSVPTSTETDTSSDVIDLVPTSTETDTSSDVIDLVPTSTEADTSVDASRERAFRFARAHNRAASSGAAPSRRSCSTASRSSESLGVEPARNARKTWDTCFRSIRSSVCWGGCSRLSATASRGDATLSSSETSGAVLADRTMAASSTASSRAGSVPSRTLLRSFSHLDPPCAEAVPSNMACTE